MPSSWQKFWNSAAVKFVPLSVVMLCGTPNLKMIDLMKLRFASPPLRVAVRRVGFLHKGPSPFFWVVDSFGAGAVLGRYRSIGPGVTTARVVLMGWRRCPL